MTVLKTVTLNGGERDPGTNAPVCQAFIPTSEDATDESARIPVGRVPLMPCLGVASMPYPPDQRGHAEGVIGEGIAGLPAVCLAGWDTRTFQMCANMKPGDTVVHSTGPNQAAQVQLKEEKRQAVLTTTRENGERLLINVDGGKNTIQIAVGGLWFEMNADEKTIEICSANGAHGIQVSDDGVWIRGEVLLGGKTAVPALKLAMCSPAGYPLGGIAPAPGVNIGVG